MIKYIENKAFIKTEKNGFIDITVGDTSILTIFNKTHKYTIFLEQPQKHKKLAYKIIKQYITRYNKNIQNSIFQFFNEQKKFTQIINIMK